MKKLFFLSKNRLLTKMLTYGALERSIPFYSLDDINEANFRISEFEAEIVLVEYSSYSFSAITNLNLSRMTLLMTEEEKNNLPHDLLNFKILLKPLSPLNWYERLLEVQ